jgi:colicin import membrane protein
MTARSPSAFAYSALLHASAAAVVFLAMFFSQRHEAKPPVIFELVAGEGNNYGATEAPALGSSDGKVKFPAIKAVPTPAPPAPTPKVESAPIPVDTAPPKAVPVPNFTKSIKRIEDRKIKKAEAQIKAQREAEAKRLSKEEFDRLHKQAAAKTAATSPRTTNAPRVDAEGIAKGVVGGSTANKTGGAGGKALTREAQSQLDGYIAFLRQQLRTAFEEAKPPGLSDRLVAIIEFHILADGTLTGARIVQSSGSDEFDRAALVAVAKVAPLGARPDGLGEVQKIPFRMLDDDSGG